MTKQVIVYGLAWLTAVALPVVAEGADPGVESRQILETSGVRGGLVVHLGCGDGKLTAALLLGDSYLVHGLDQDPGKIAEARRHAESLGLHGPVSFQQWTGGRLPYSDNLAALVVVSHPPPVAREEILRVLRPGGVAVFTAGGGKTPREKTVKPWPSDIDRWTHYLYDASNNPVSSDEKVGPPRHLQWSCEPRWLRSHNWNPGVTGMVTDCGRLFYIIDEAPIGIVHTSLPEKWSLVARDAFSGKLLWKLPMREWGWREWEYANVRNNWSTPSALWSTPPVLPRRIVAAGDRVYATLAYQAPVSEIDAATGKVLRTFEGTDKTDEILFLEDKLIVRTRSEIVPVAETESPSPRAMPDDLGRSRNVEERANLPQDRQQVVVLDTETGRVLWMHECRPIGPLTLCAGHGSACFHDYQSAVCLDLATGRERWRVKTCEEPFAPERFQPRGVAATLMIYQDTLFCRDRGGWTFVNIDSGQATTAAKILGSFGFGHWGAFFVADGTLWSHGGSRGWSPKTGEPARELDIGDMLNRGHHVRCTIGKATQHYLITPLRGAEFVDLRGDNHAVTDWLRGACSLGVVPANGLLYNTPDPCNCYAGTKMNGFHACYAAPGRADQLQAVGSPSRLEKGPAFGSLDRSAASPSASDWPMYRHDIERSGCAGSPLSADLQRQWNVQLGGTLTPPVIVGDRLYAAGMDAHLLHCLDAGTGQTLWTFTSDGPVDTPPAVAGSAVVFGGRDGWVYCLRASDGFLAWRFRAAPGERLVVHQERLESAWPVHGAVVVHQGLVYCLAGRSSFLDGGLFLYALEVATGAVVHHAQIDGPWQTPQALRTPVVDQKIARDDTIEDRFQRAQQSTNLKGHATGYDMEGTRADILVSDGEAIWLPQMKLDMKLNVADTPRQTWDGNRRLGAHLMATSGFRDDSLFHRTCWLYSEYWPGFPSGMAAANAGNLLAFDGEESVAAKMFPRGGRYPNHGLLEGTTLVADLLSNQWWEKDGQRVYAVSNGLQRHQPPLWETNLPIIPRAMVLAPQHGAESNKVAFVAGPRDEMPADDLFAAWEGRRGAKLFAVSMTDGEVLSETNLPHPPVWDGMAAAGGRLFVATVDGTVICWGKQERQHGRKQ